MTDLINRQDAIDALEKIDWYHQNKNKDMVQGANSAENQAWYKEQDVFKAIEQLPSAQERKTGTWKARNFHVLYCTNCGFEFDIMTCEFMCDMKYCPNCGARMEV